MKLQQIQENLPREAPGCISLQPDAFVSDWERRPQDTVVLGFRLLGAKNKRDAIRMAREKVARNEGESLDHEEAVALAAMRYLVGMAVCDPNDATRNSAVFEFPLEQVFLGLTEGGARYLFDAYQRVEVEKSPAYLEATEDEIAELSERLAEGALMPLSASDLSAARRHLRFALELLRGD